MTEEAVAWGSIKMPDPYRTSANLPNCLPVPPSMRRLTVVEVTYCIARRSDNLHHNHVAFYDADTGDLIVDHCTIGAEGA